jgi:hypothetical protein
VKCKVRKCEVEKGGQTYALRDSVCGLVRAELVCGVGGGAGHVGRAARGGVCGRELVDEGLC